MTRPPRPVRRLRTVAPPVALLALALGGCAGIGQPAAYDAPGINGLVVPTPDVDPQDFVEDVDNPWFPLVEDTAWSYEARADGRVVGTLDVEVVDTSVPVAGLDATEVRTTSDVAGRGGESTRFYAQDRDGNVWLVGADAADASWRAGEDGAEAGLAMPADPRLGDGWLSYVVPGLPRASATIEDQTAELVQTRDEADTTTRNVYEKGVGLVGLEDLDAGWTAQLVDG